MARLFASHVPRDECGVEDCTSTEFSEKPYVVVPIDSDGHLSCRGRTATWGIMKLCLAEEKLWRERGVKDACFMTRKRAMLALSCKLADLQTQEEPVISKYSHSSRTLRIVH